MTHSPFHHAISRDVAPPTQTYVVERFNQAFGVPVFYVAKAPTYSNTFAAIWTREIKHAYVFSDHAGARKIAYHWNESWGLHVGYAYVTEIPGSL